MSARVVLGVSGGIAAYKAADLLRRLTESGVSVRVVPTESALHFVGAATWAALSGQPVSTDVWSDVHEVPHVRLGQQADLVLVAPATADLLAKAAHGLADDLLTSTLLTARCPVVFAPAMHTEMWEHPATQDNVAALRRRGAIVLDPAVGRLTGADSGAGRLPDPAELAAVAMRILRRGVEESADLAGRHVVVSAGGTREFLDPVRYLGNRSSGRQGYALARTAAARGARVTLIAANTGLPDPAGVTVVPVVTTEELRAAVLSAAFGARVAGAGVTGADVVGADVVGADVVVMAAAPADYRPADVSAHKVKKAEDGTGRTLELVQNPDVLAELVARRASSQVMVGFAAETGDESGSVRVHGDAKLARKGCDLLVVNDVSAGQGFDSPDNAAVILGSDGTVVDVPRGPKEDLADVIWDLVVKRLASR